jgi:hypothetical protein
MPRFCVLRTLGVVPVALPCRDSAPQCRTTLPRFGPLLVNFLRSTLLPAAIVLLFGLALFAVSARIWLPGDMAAPAPVG